jgi:hypothetical protein
LKSCDPRDGVVDLGGKRLRGRVVPVHAPRRDQVRALLHPAEELRDLLGLILEIRVHREDDRVAALVEPGRERGRLAEVPAKANDAGVLRVAHIERLEELRGAVPAAVVHEDDLVAVGDLGENPVEPRLQLLQVRFLVEERYDDGDVALSGIYRRLHSRRSI